jgi:hypothetical protein
MIDPARDHKDRYPAKAAGKSGVTTFPLCGSTITLYFHTA